MASPIFISNNNNPSLTPSNIVRGVFICLRSILALLCNPFKCVSVKTWLLVVLSSAAISQFLLNYIPSLILCWICQFDKLQISRSDASILIDRYLNLINLPTLVISYFVTRSYNQQQQTHHSTLTDIFHNRLAVISSPKFTAMIENLPDRYQGWHYQYKHQTEVVNHRLIQTHLGNVGYICSLMLYSWYYKGSNLSNWLISFHILRQYHHKIGMISVSFILAVLLFLQYIPLERQVFYYFKFQLIETLLHSSLFNYFNKLSLSKASKDQWCDSRFGIILGWSTPIVTLMSNSPHYGSFVLVLISVVSADLVWHTTEESSAVTTSVQTSSSSTSSTASSSRSSSPNRNKLDPMWILREVYYNGAFGNEGKWAISRTSYSPRLSAVNTNYTTSIPQLRSRPVSSSSMSGSSSRLKQLRDQNVNLVHSI
ncbi:hypothetical protein WICPIJ_005533 [Wickerhamomyces pijperi]|uniref:Uncharacterized protein n=1 Tax=Wickerhamomyces pijperi TaxID=599730 RepID=A0A9P8Q5T7_WICPI|nr:hypothetical protein WICPIJ_005533 [Wickerhamomyces pijperi]